MVIMRAKREQGSKQDRERGQEIGPSEEQMK
jgi:hypothetical protein